MSLVIRKATAADCGRVAELAGQLGYPMEQATARARITLLGTSAERALVVAERDGRDAQIIGWLEFEVHESFLSGSVGEIAALVVDADARRSGAGRALVAWAEEATLAHGITRLRVRSNSTRIEPVSFYPALGFREVKLARVFEKTLASSQLR
ncbi:MAG: GNAT family N-acetyltransferase [Phycisphaerae bacterium]|nr:GNAT family N-acetyltransferase [Phycisphaerae bacterium]